MKAERAPRVHYIIIVVEIEIAIVEKDKWDRNRIERGVEGSLE